MFNPLQAIEKIEVEVFTSVPAKFRKMSRTQWSDANRQGTEVECFLEGPSFDRAGNLWIVDVAFGRIFRISPNKEWELVIQYDGWPNGLKIHQDGRIFICDYKNGIMLLDPVSGRIEPYLDTVYSESFKGVNDLHFASNGDMYFTDQGQTGIADPSGRVYRLKADGRLDRLLGNVPSPNGVTLSANEKQCYVAATRSQQIWRLPIMADGSISKTGVAIQLSGGIGGPDGIEMDAENGLVVCHLGVGIWRFNDRMLPTHFIHSSNPAHYHMANIAFGGPERKTLFITDSGSGDILCVKLPVAGKIMFAHS